MNRDEMYKLSLKAPEAKKEAQKRMLEYEKLIEKKAELGERYVDPHVYGGKGKEDACDIAKYFLDREFDVQVLRPTGFFKAFALILLFWLLPLEGSNLSPYWVVRVSWCNKDAVPMDLIT